MEIIYPRASTYSLGPSTFQGLAGQYAKSAITTLAGQIYEQIKQIRPLMQRYGPDLKKTDPWWVDHFEETAKMFDEYWTAIRAMSPDANFDANYADLLKTREGYSKLLTRLTELATYITSAEDAARKAAAAEGRKYIPPPPPPPAPPLPKDLPPAVGGGLGISPMMIGGIVLAVAAVGILLTSGDGQ